MVLRWILGMLFIYAGATKAMNPDGFVADLGRYQLLPELIVTPVSVYLPYLEIVAGLALITGVYYLGALLLIKAMLLVFSAGLASAWWRGLDITCGCFGRGWGDMPASWALFRNGVLLVVCLVLVAAYRTRLSVAAKLTSSEG